MIIKVNKKLVLPSYICLVKYNPKNKENISNNNDINNLFFSDYYSNINSQENISIAKDLKNGHYLFYSYINFDYKYNNSISKEGNSYIIKFDSNKDFIIAKKPCDIKENDFPVLKNIKIQEYLYSNNIIHYNKGINTLVKYKNKDLAMKIIYNPNNKWLKIVEDYTEIKNIFILSPYQNYYDGTGVLEWYVPPKEFNALLGMIIDSSIEGNLNLQSKTLLIKTVPIKYKNYQIDLSKYT